MKKDDAQGKRHERGKAAGNGVKGLEGPAAANLKKEAGYPIASGEKGGTENVEWRGFQSF